MNFGLLLEKWSNNKIKATVHRVIGYGNERFSIPFFFEPSIKSYIKPIKELGLHELVVNLHPEVTANIEINVARSEEEADIQKSGKTIQDAKMEADAEAEFDIAELFDDVGSAAKIDEETSDLSEETIIKD